MRAKGQFMVMQRVFVSGRLHKTGFRDFVVRKAQEYGLIGWVRNRTDGRVEILVVGDEEAAARLIDDCREGPPMARVDNIEAHVDTERMPKGFTKRFTA